jgi:hypothetical protein
MTARPGLSASRDRGASIPAELCAGRRR